MRLALTLAAMLTACGQHNSDPSIDMSAEEKKSYAAVERYVDCMKPIVTAAKRSGALTDQASRNLGARCPEELEQAARAKASRSDLQLDNAIYQRMTFEQRAGFHRDDLIDVFWCDLRPHGPECRRTD